MTIIASPEMQKYFADLSQQFEKAYAVAQQARAIGVDPEAFVEVAPAADVAARVEGIVGPKGVSERIRELCATKTREDSCFQIAREILEGKYAEEGASLQSKIEQAVRTGLALATEGVVSAPIEGISRIEVRKNSDGSHYLAVVFAGPIRGAGGTGQAIALLLADVCRQAAKISNYRPSGDEVDRAVEELNLYSIRTRAGQYVPTEEEIRHIWQNCPVCVDGEPSEDYEISNKRGLFVTVVNERGEKRVPVTNTVRSGMCLVTSEGVCLKAAKVLKIAKKQGLDWSWIEKMIKVGKQEKQFELKPISKYMDEIVAGRPIFSYPMRPGGFRLRYGRTRLTGIAAKGMHPASMIALGSFPAMGTQLKIERPGKGAVVTPCTEIDGPVVKLNDGSVVRLETVAQAEELYKEIAEVLFIGDLLVSYGDFLKANHPLVPSGYCEEWHQKLLESKGIVKTTKEVREIGAKQAVESALKDGVPLAPRWTYFWHDLTADQLRELADWLGEKGSCEFEWFEFKGITVQNAPQKRILELLCIPHKLEGEKVIVECDDAFALLSSMGLLEVKEKKISLAKFDKAWEERGEKSVLEIVNDSAGFTVMKKAGLYIGSSMGRPEKAKPRQMKPPVNALFPIGFAGGKLRSLIRAVKTSGGTNSGYSENSGAAQSGAKGGYGGTGSQGGKGIVELELANRVCSSCGTLGWKSKCSCGGHTILVKKCLKCGKVFSAEKELCKCGGIGSLYEKKPVNLSEEFKGASAKADFTPQEIKAVIGLISDNKTAEPLEKGVLRAKRGLTVFRDGTARFDGTEIPMTHFIPRESGVSVQKLRELGYDKDAKGAPLKSDSQVVELRVQDLILPYEAAEYFIELAGFCDDLLVHLYDQKPFYSLKTKEELLGQLVTCLAPHTSACVLARVVGFTKAKGILAHPFLHCACRRNCDGDEIAVMLLMDILLNFSLSYLPVSRGGKMDAPLVLTSVINTTEIDDEAHAMDCAWSYPLEFYEATLKSVSPGEAKIETVASRLNTERQYQDIGYTHECIMEGPERSAYVTLGSMKEKVEIELEMMKKIRAVEVSGAAERILLSHFFPDLYGNLRSFSKQGFRCVDCNAKYRRVPLAGKCTRNNCGGKLLLTINKGGIEKYLKLSQQMVADYGLPNYLKQRLQLVEKEIKSIFEDDKAKQFSLAEYV